MEYHTRCVAAGGTTICFAQSGKRKKKTQQNENYCETEISETRQKRSRPKVSDKKNGSETTSSSSAILDQS